MAQKKISELDAAAAALGAMQLEVNDNGTSKRLTLTQVIALLDIGDVVKDDVLSTLVAGYVSSPEAVGEITSGTYTPTLSATQGNVKAMENGGAHTWAIPASNGTTIHHVTNNSSAGAITFASGYMVVSGDDLTTVDADEFFVQTVRVGAAVSAVVQALQ
ncbi:hypothetical protein BD1_21 [Octadecabacter Antarctic BD virus 1]|nr:hypothetical protein BD1_21 [Octadecabacter Antarctic BD virus 1]